MSSLTSIMKRTKRHGSKKSMPLICIHLHLYRPNLIASPREIHVNYQKADSFPKATFRLPPLRFSPKAAA